MTSNQPIVHPTDFSRASQAAFMRAIDMAKREGAELVLVHVLEPLSRSSRTAPRRTTRSCRPPRRRRLD